ncbi:MAG: hypothetical protein JWO83_3896 [Caulobacteraceae bacterium]|nr:hypothetical protein [Caulobacteraceae bacterium]
MQAFLEHPVGAFSASRRGSRKTRKYEPSRSLGIRSSTVLARVSQFRCLRKAIISSSVILGSSVMVEFSNRTLPKTRR